VSKDGGRIYFSSSSSIPPSLNREGYYDTMHSYLLTALSGRPTGKLLSYSMQTRKTTLLVDGIYFANGVALSQDESFVLVAETTSMRIIRCWLKGPKAGKTDVFADRIPGFPHGITRASDGSFYVAVIFPDNVLLRNLLNAPSMVRWALSWILQLYRPLPTKMGIVIQV
jgi:sugar lactone lactonase YvrE